MQIYLWQKIIDKRIWQIIDELERKNNQSPLLLVLNRLLDDPFLVLQRTTRQVHLLLKNIDKIHTSIQFTMQKKKKRKKDEIAPKRFSSILGHYIDLFRKECDRNQYLLPSRIRPVCFIKNIPFSLALRIIRT